MKLSTAIILGTMLRPQSFSGFYEARDRPLHQHSILGLVVEERVSSCALGAAYEAVGCRSHTEISTKELKGFRGSIKAGDTLLIMETPDEWYPVFYFQTGCPSCGKADEVRRLIPHLNDDHKWAREQIAAFVATVEERLGLCEIISDEIQESASLSSR